MDSERLLKYAEMFGNMAQKIESEMQDEKKRTGKAPGMTGTEFEDIVYQGLRAEGFSEEQIWHSPQKFPDFIISDKHGTKVGLEVKKTDGSKWEIIGGSVFESLKSDIEETYVIMAKLGGANPEVRLKKYEDCIADMKVTHSPRFYLDLDLKPGEDYLTRHDSKDLLELNGDELNKRIRELLRTNRSTWWSEAMVTRFADLPEREKSTYLNDGLALFPEVFGSNYEHFTPWLYYSCLVWCGNIRDIFSAGGVVMLSGQNIYVSAVMGRAYDNAEAIRTKIMEMDDDELIKFWGTNINTQNRIDTWISIANSCLRLSKNIYEKNRVIPRYFGLTDLEIERNVRNIYFEALKEKMQS